MELNLTKASANIGDKVEILLNKKDFYKKSVRRNIVDSIMEKWRMNTITNLGTDFNTRIRFKDTPKRLKMLLDIHSKKLSCEPTIFNRHQEAKQWFKMITKCLNNIEGAFVIGVEASAMHCSDICPSNVNYITNENRFYYKYKIMIHGYVPNESKFSGPESNLNSQDTSLHKAGMNHIQFWVELLEDDFKVIK